MSAQRTPTNNVPKNPLPFGERAGRGAGAAGDSTLPQPLPKREGGVARSRLAFTLVELLVTIAIIGILVGLLIPAVAAVRRTTKEAACKATLAALETGLETFKADAKLGGQYPPSVPDWAQGGDWCVNSPYGDPIPPRITGAGLLVWALSGADLLGTPGFAPFGGAQYWGESSGAGTCDPPDPNCPAYALTGAYQPVHPRYGPYVDGSKVQVTRNQPKGSASHFAIPEEEKAVEALRANPRDRMYPMYLDAFGFPVLYWRADPAGREMARDGRMGSTERAIYWVEDNARLVDPNLPGVSGDEVLVLNKAGDAHLLSWTVGPAWTPYNSGKFPSDDLTDPTFPTYIRNRAVRARWEPARPDSYLLVTAGQDGRYGTGDDITNFAHNGQ